MDLVSHKSEDLLLQSADEEGHCRAEQPCTEHRVPPAKGRLPKSRTISHQESAGWGPRENASSAVMTLSSSDWVAVAARLKDTLKKQKLTCETWWGVVKAGHDPFKLDILFTHVLASEFESHSSFLIASDSGSLFTFTALGFVLCLCNSLSFSSCH